MPSADRMTTPVAVDETKIEGRTVGQAARIYPLALRAGCSIVSVSHEV